MWELKEPRPVKLITGILACDERCLAAARSSLESVIDQIDLVSDIWPFDQTSYYADEIGPSILRQFVSFARLIDPGELADLKHRTNAIEQELAGVTRPALSPAGEPRPRNYRALKACPGDNQELFSSYIHRQEDVRRGDAGLRQGPWRPLPHTYPDYRSGQYFDFLHEGSRPALGAVESRGPGAGDADLCRHAHSVWSMSVRA